MEKQVKDCSTCPFNVTSEYGYNCWHPQSDGDLRASKVRQFEHCPLKNEPITITLTQNEF